MLSPKYNINFQEMREVGVYESLLRDIEVYRERILCLTDEEGDYLADACLENIEHAYREDFISDEMVRYLTSKILHET